MQPAIVLASALALAGLVFASPAPVQDSQDLKLARFFGVCDTKSSDVAAAVGEACIGRGDHPQLLRSGQRHHRHRAARRLRTATTRSDRRRSMVGGNPPDRGSSCTSTGCPEFASIGALAEHYRARQHGRDGRVPL